MLTFHLDTYPQSFLPLIYCPVDDTLFKVSPDLCSFRYVKLPLQLWKQHSWFCANLKTFHCSHLIIEQDLSLPKIISKCELLELCHINHRGQVFLRHSVDISRWIVKVGIRGEQREFCCTLVSPARIVHLIEHF